MGYFLEEFPVVHASCGSARVFDGGEERMVDHCSRYAGHLEHQFAEEGAVEQSLCSLVVDLVVAAGLVAEGSRDHVESAQPFV